MKKCYNSMTRLMRAARIGTALSAAIFAATALQAQYAGPAPQAPQSPPPGNTDGISHASHAAKDFMQDAAQANQTEIAMANIAEARSETPVVKELAQMMRADHQQNYDLLQVMAQNHLVALDGSLNSVNQRAVNRLQKAGDADFDKDFTKVMLKDHVKCIARFARAVTDIEEPYVKDYAQNTLPALRKHLLHTETAARSVGVDEATISSILKGLPSDEARAVSFNQN
jgi:putative membrane protein